MKNRVPTKILESECNLPIESTFFLKRSWLEDPYTNLFSLGVWPEDSYENVFFKKCWLFRPQHFPSFVPNCPKMSKNHKKWFEPIPSPEYLIYFIYFMLYPIYPIYYILYIIHIISYLCYIPSIYHISSYIFVGVRREK